MTKECKAMLNLFNIIQVAQVDSVPPCIPTQNQDQPEHRRRKNKINPMEEEVPPEKGLQGKFIA